MNSRTRWLRRSTRDEELVRAYVDGRNAARDGEARTAPEGVSDLEAINWEVGYDDMRHEMEGEG
jgi:hypothetical protein